jgi:glucosamine-6-phosphate deaminase
MSSARPLKQWHVEAMEVRIYPDRKALGEAAAEHVAAILKKAIETRGRCVAVFASGVSQVDFLAALRKQFGIDWGHVVAFHLDEYVGMTPDHPASIRRYLREHLFEVVSPKEIHLLNGEAPDPQAECERYSWLLAKAGPPDIACIGIGENGHIAFNDPHVADFNDPKMVKVVDPDEPCRRQQLGEGWFATFDEVPKLALTQTIPAILSARAISCVVPERRKAEAVQRALEGPIAPICPASVLRRHENCVLYLDRESAALLDEASQAGY